MYRVFLLAEAEEDLRELKKKDKENARLVSEKLIWLQAHAGSIQHLALHGPWSGYSKRPVGNYRIVYQIDYETSTIYVFRIGDRKDVYDV